MININKMSLKTKIGTLFVVIAVATAFSFYKNQNGFDRLTKSYERLSKENYSVMDDLNQINIVLLQLRRHEKDFLLRRDSKYVQRHKEEFNVIEKKIEHLKNLDAKNATSYDEILKNARAYEKGFQNIVKAINTEGDSNNGIRGELRSIAHKIEESIKKNNLGSELYVTLLNYRRREKDYLLRRDPSYLKKLQKDIQSFETLLANTKAPLAPATSLKELNSKFETVFKELIANNDLIEKITSDFRGNIHAVESISKDLTKMSQENLEAEIKNINKDVESINLLTLALGVMQLLVVVGTAWILFRLIKSLINSSETLTKIVNSFQEITNKVYKTSTELSSLTTEQASAIQETASSVTEINSMVERTTQNTLSSKELSEVNAKEANIGRGTINNVIKSMEAISDSTGMMTQTIEKNSQELQGVVDIINTIDEKTKIIHDIVFQTKLLSFNASVEAARAGEHGKGFAVVAEEISNLADVSGSSAKEITEILAQSVNKVQSLVDNNRTELNRILVINNERVSQGHEAATECDKVLSKMLENINNITVQITDISEASIEQSNGVQEISEAINQLSSANQDIATMSNQTDTLSQSIFSESQSIANVVQELRRTVFGSSLLNNQSQKAINEESQQIKDQFDDDVA